MCYTGAYLIQTDLTAVSIYVCPWHLYILVSPFWPLTVPRDFCHKTNNYQHIYQNQETERRLQMSDNGIIVRVNEIIWFSHLFFFVLSKPMYFMCIQTTVATMWLDDIIHNFQEDVSFADQKDKLVFSNGNICQVTK